MQSLTVWLLLILDYCMGNTSIEIKPKNDQTLVIGEGLNLTCTVKDCNTNGKPQFYYKHKDDKNFHRIYETMPVNNCTLKLFLHKMEKPGTQHFFCNTSRLSLDHRYTTIRVFDPTIGKVGCEVNNEDYTTTMSCQGWCSNGKPDRVNIWKGIVRYENKPVKNFTKCNVALPFNGCGIYSFYVNKTYVRKKSNATQDLNIRLKQVKVKVAWLNATMQAPNKVLISWDPPDLNITDNCPVATPHYWISYTIQPPGAGEEVLNVTKEYLGKIESFILMNIFPNTTLDIEVAMSFDRHTHGIPRKLTYTAPSDDVVSDSVTPTIKNYSLSGGETQIIGVVCGSLAAVTVLFVTQCLARRWYRRNRTIITPPPPHVMHEMNGGRWTRSGRSQNSDYTILPFDTQ